MQWNATANKQEVSEMALKFLFHTNNGFDDNNTWWLHLYAVIKWNDFRMRWEGSDIWDNPKTCVDEDDFMSENDFQIIWILLMSIPEGSPSVDGFDIGNG